MIRQAEVLCYNPETIGLQDSSSSVSAIFELAFRVHSFNSLGCASFHVSITISPLQVSCTENVGDVVRWYILCSSIDSWGTCFWSCFIFDLYIIQIWTIWIFLITLTKSLFLFQFEYTYLIRLFPLSKTLLWSSFHRFPLLILNSFSSMKFSCFELCCWGRLQFFLR